MSNDRSLARYILDGWSNLLTGLGTSTDKSQQTQVAARAWTLGRVLDIDLCILYHESYVYRKACDKPTEIEFSKGFEIATQDKEGATRIETRLRELDAAGHIQRGRSLERGFGGAATWIVVNDGQAQDMPLDLERLQEVIALRTFDRRSFAPRRYYDDPLNPKDGTPEIFEFTHPETQRKTLIHESRLLLYLGAHRTPDYLDVGQAGRGIGTPGSTGVWWGLPIFVPIFEALQRNANAHSAAGYMVNDASFSILKLSKLSQILSSQGADKVRERAQAIENVRSVLHSVVIGEDEEYTRVSPSFGGMPEMLTSLRADLAAALDMPQTVLFGSSPAGMNATGESDLQLWHESVVAKREHSTTPKVEMLARIVGAEQGVSLEDFAVVWPPLHQPTAQDEANMRLQQAQTDQLYFQMGLSGSEILLSRFTDEGYSTETTIDTQFYEEMIELDHERAENPPAPPVMVPEGEEDEPGEEPAPDDDEA